MINHSNEAPKTRLTEPLRFYLLSLGCSKNLVDSESMSQILRDAGDQVIDDPLQADVLLVNTCGFIESAKKEAIEAILDLADYKQPNGRAKYLIVAGCLSQRYAQEILDSFPEVNAVLGTADYARIHDLISRLYEDELPSDGQLVQALPGPGGSLEHLRIARSPSTPQTYAYIKVAEGCSNHCTYCAIPGIRGPFQSRPFEEIVDEASRLSESGFGELILIAQDTTRYGLDLYGHRRLPDLIRSICSLPRVRMVRILYVYTDGLTDDLIACMATESKVAHYLDLPIQHASNGILSAMNRRDSQESIRLTIDRLRQAMPDIVLRSTVLVGFPGESEEDFQALLDFLNEVRFDRLGCFVFSAEEGTLAASLKPKIPKATAIARMDAVMQKQQVISREINQARIGHIYTVSLDSIADDGVFYKGRSFAEAPEVDPVIWVAAAQDNLSIGLTAQVRIVAADEYELTGETIA